MKKLILLLLIFAGTLEAQERLGATLWKKADSSLTPTNSNWYVRGKIVNSPTGINLHGAQRYNSGNFQVYDNTSGWVSVAGDTVGGNFVILGYLVVDTISGNLMVVGNITASGNIGANSTSPLHRLVGVVNSSNLNGLNIVNSDRNKDRSTVAEATDTCSVFIRFTSGGKPEFYVKGTTGNTFAKIDSIGITTVYSIWGGDFNCSATQYYIFTGRSKIGSSSNGTLQFWNNSGTANTINTQGAIVMQNQVSQLNALAVNSWNGAATNASVDTSGNATFKKVTYTSGSITSVLSGSVVYDIGEIAHDEDSTFTISVVGAVAGDVVTLGYSTAPEGSIVFKAYCATNDVVTISAYNHYHAAVDPASRTYKVQIIK